jgi:glucose/arabinose dehydrogenase
MQCAQLPAGSVTPPFFTYDHGSGSAVIGGPFYTGTLYPQEYRGNFFFSDYSGNFIKRVMLTRSTGRSRCSPSRRMSPGL